MKGHFLRVLECEMQDALAPDWLARAMAIRPRKSRDCASDVCCVCCEATDASRWRATSQFDSEVKGAADGVDAGARARGIPWRPDTGTFFPYVLSRSGRLIDTTTSVAVDGGLIGRPKAVAQRRLREKNTKNKLKKHREARARTGRRTERGPGLCGLAV